jgi:uncharacterized protein
MKEATAKAVIENIFSINEQLRVAIYFQGGEPTMAGIDFFVKFTEMVDEAKGENIVEYGLQTNGTLLNEKWYNFLKERDFLVGLSLDMMKNNHNSYRLTQDDGETFDMVMDIKRLLELHGIRYNILTVLTNSLANYPDKVWKFIEKNGIEYTQFVPCLIMDDECDSQYALTPERFYSFYKRLFELWSIDFEAGKYRSIKLFDDLINLLADGSVNACGLVGKCSPQMVVEADGSVYPCDFYCIDSYKVGNLATQNIEDILNDKRMYEFLSRDRDKMQLCTACKYNRICGGGCPKMRREVCQQNDGEFCGYQKFLDATIDKMYQYAMVERAYK